MCGVERLAGWQTGALTSGWRAVGERLAISWRANAASVRLARREAHLICAGAAAERSALLAAHPGGCSDLASPPERAVGERLASGWRAVVRGQHAGTGVRLARSWRAAG